MEKRIGVFDSGFGGLTIFKELVSQLPEYDYIYLGDSARAPYGNRSQELIFTFTKQAVDYLFKPPHQKFGSGGKSGRRIFLTTDLTDKFQKLGSLFYGQEIFPKVIQLEK